MNENFSKFVNKHFYIKKDLMNRTIFIPIIPGRNEYRHLGIKLNNELIFCKTEILYLYLKSHYNNEMAEVKKLPNLLRKNGIFNEKFAMYCYLKEIGYNILQTTENTKIYLKTKDFKRNESKEVGTFIIRHGFDNFDVNYNTTFIAGIHSQNVFTFLKVTPLETISKYTPPNLKKNKKF